MTNSKWTKDFIPDLRGKVVVVTGGNSGIGYESVKAYAEKGAEVIMACRSVEKGEKAKNEILAIKPSGVIKVWSLDLMDLTSVKEFAERMKREYTRLDILLNNAGIMMVPYAQTKDGFESQIGTNHLGHFALTGLLLPILKTTPNSRVVTTSSIAHRSAKMDFSNLIYINGKGYSPVKAYGRSKLANLLFAYELQRKFEKAEINALSLAAHPGVSQTNLGRHLYSRWWYKIFFMPLMALVTHEPDYAALPQIRASVDKDAKGGDYYGPTGFREMKGYPDKVQSNPLSHNIDLAQKLWHASEELTGVRYEL